MNGDYNAVLKLVKGCLPLSESNYQRYFYGLKLNGNGEFKDLNFEFDKPFPHSNMLEAIISDLRFEQNVKIVQEEISVT